MSAVSKDNGTTRESLELLYHVSRELTSALELRTVLERVLFLAMRTVGAIRGTIIVMDDKGKPVESAIISGDQFMQHTTQRLRATLDHGLAGWVVRNREAALISDTSQDERWMLRQYDIEEKTGPKSAVSAPLMAREKLVGVMTLVHPQAGFFTLDHLELVQAISDQAGVAVSNARLYEESQRQARAMTALAESAATITGSLNVEDVLSRILEQISQALAVPAVALALIEPNSQDLVVRAATGWKKAKEEETRIKIGQSIAGWVAKEGRGVIVHDAHQDPRFDIETDLRTGLRTQAIACAPLRYRGQVIGVLEAINPTDESFDPDALFVLTGIGSLAGTAVRHAQLFERLQAAHQSYRDLFDDSIDPILITDWEGNIIEANRKATVTTEYNKEALRQMTIQKIHAVDQEQVGINFEKLSPETPIFYESRLRSNSGYEMPVEVYVRPVEIEENSYIQWLIRDITERKKLDSMREDLLSMIYHDLRSPLSNVVSSLDVLDSMLPVEDDPSIRPLLGIALRSVERIQRLTNSLLDINRLEAGQPVGARQPTPPASMIDEAFDLVSPVAENKQQTMNRVVPSDLSMVVVDAEMIRRVITNLLENASKYTPTGSDISIGAENAAEFVKFWVQDNGPGIPASEHERIFNKFTRLEQRETLKKGLGLGLAYCKLAVQAHGGRIWLESEPGSGSCFYFTLPIAREGYAR